MGYPLLLTTYIEVILANYWWNPGPSDDNNNAPIDFNWARISPGIFKVASAQPDRLRTIEIGDGKVF